LISVCVNVDTRPQSSTFRGLGEGVRSYELLTDGLRNKRKFFDGHQIEMIVYVDEHERLPVEILEEMRSIADCVVVRKHTKHYLGSDPHSDFNSASMLNCLSLARGEHICHMDMDTAVFGNASALEVTSDSKIFCYPSQWSPKPIEDPSFGKHVWASTRLFFCHRSMLKMDELYEAVRDPLTIYAKYGVPERVHNWLEHYIGLSAGYRVYYPPCDYSWMAFCWTGYKAGTLARLDGLPYERQVELIKAAGGMSYDGVDANMIPE